MCGCIVDLATKMPLGRREGGKAFDVGRTALGLLLGDWCGSGAVAVAALSPLCIDATLDAASLPAAPASFVGEGLDPPLSETRAQYLQSCVQGAAESGLGSGVSFAFALFVGEGLLPAGTHAGPGASRLCLPTDTAGGRRKRGIPKLLPLTGLFSAGRRNALGRLVSAAGGERDVRDVPLRRGFW